MLSWLHILTTDLLFPLTATAPGVLSSSVYPALTHPSRTMTYRTLSTYGLPYSLPPALAVPTLYRIIRHLHPSLTITHRTLSMYSLPPALAVPTLSHSHSNLLHGCLFRRPLISTSPQKDRSITNVEWVLELKSEAFLARRIGPC
jgi:hypothetical protein